MHLGLFHPRLLTFKLIPAYKCVYSGKFQVILNLAGQKHCVSGTSTEK